MNFEPLPACRFRGREVTPQRWICRSPKLVLPGRVIEGSFCREQCPFVDSGDNQVPPRPYHGYESFPVAFPSTPVRQVKTRARQLAVGMITAPRRCPTAISTLYELRRAGFSGEIQVFAEPGAELPEMPGVVCHANQARLGLWQNWKSAARQLLDSTTCEFLLLCEDDLWLAPCAALALQHAMHTLPRETWGYASLYSPVHNVRGAQPVVGWQRWHQPQATWGALAYCFTRDSLAAALAAPTVRNHTGDRDTDLVVTATLRSLGRNCYFHVPSLAAHAGGLSSAAGHTWQHDHAAYGFDHEYQGYVETKFNEKSRREAKSLPLNVAFLTPNLLLGGVEHWFLDLASNTDSARIRWHLGLTNPTYQEPSVVRRVRAVASLAVGQAAVRLMCSKADIVVLWGLDSPRTWMSDFSGPVVGVAHGSCAWTAAWLRSANRELTHRVAVSSLASNSFGPADVRVICNGVAPERCRPVIAGNTTRAAWQLASGDLAVGFIGRISAEKNCGAIAAAVEALGPPHRLILIGKAYDSAHERKLRAHLPDARFIPPLEQIGDALAALDVLVIASPHEGGPLVALEAMLAGVPVAATRVGLIDQIVSEHGELASLAPFHPTPEQLAAAIRRALSPAWQEVLPKAREVILRQYTAQRMADEWTKYLGDIHEADVDR